MLKVYYSDRMEILAGHLTERLEGARLSPLQSHWVGVRNPAMGQWLQQRIATHQGAVVNLHCVNGETWARRLCEAQCPDCTAPLPWDRRYLSWRILRVFENAGEDNTTLPGPWQTLDHTARFRLAWQLAGCFAGYLIEQPDWLEVWGRGAGDHWQAQLWWALGLSQEYQELLQRLTVSTSGELRAAFWLGVGFPHLPPQFLRSLASKIDLHMMVWMPGGALSRPQATGNPLRRSTLALEQHQHRQLQDLADQVVDCHSQEPPGTSLLAMLQGDILADRLRGSGGLEPRSVSPRDRSLQVHSCHSPMREVEVLYEQLLALFQADPELQPADIQVLIPSHGDYGALVEAVFGAAEGDRFIPFSVGGESRISGLMGVFMALLQLPAEEFATAPVLAILEKEAVRRRFGLGLDDLPVIQRWVGSPGLDRVLSEDQHIPDWRQRLAALMLGYALGEGIHPPLGGILPDSQVQDREAAMLGRLQGFIEALVWLRETLSVQTLAVTHWQACLMQILERFFEPSPGDAASLLALRQILLDIQQEAAVTGFDQPVALPVLLGHVQTRLQEQAMAKSCVPGGLQFSTPRAALGTPAAVVCVLGAGSALSPTDAPGNLDQLRISRPHWSHQRLHAWFLQALLAARRVFYVSYVGRSIHDNRPIPVVAPVACLLDAVGAGFWVEGGGDIAPEPVEHALLSVNQRYFRRTGALFSYAEELCAASRLLGQGNAEPGSLVLHALAPPEPTWQTVELENLARFFRHPTRFLLRERLGLDLDDYRRETHDPRRPASVGEPLATTLLDLYLQGPVPGSVGDALRAAGLLAPGQPGEVELWHIRQRLEAFMERLQRAQEATLLNPLELDTLVTDTRLVGRLNGVSAQGLLAFGATPPDAAEMLQLWLRHLVLNLLAPPGVMPVSTWMDPWGGFSFQPVVEPLGILDKLLDCYQEGLRRPLHLFPETALAFVQAGREADLGLPEDVARRIWEGSTTQPGEEQDPYIRLAFRGEDPLDEEFARLSSQVFVPLLERRRGLGR